jgi:hypothetical protein
MRRRIALLLSLLCCCASAQELKRATVWDLKIGQPLAAQPTTDAFVNFACGADGGPPRQPLRGFDEFERCRPGANGWHEVYFEYDDEYEYIARAKDLPREVARWAGTTESGFPVMVSALIDDQGVVKGIRIVTDARPDHRPDTIDANLKKRADAYQFGALMAARHGIEAKRDCTALPAADGESPVGTLFVKQSCELFDAARALKISLRVNYFRKPGQSGANPQAPTQLTQGQFESSARLQISVFGDR